LLIFSFIFLRRPFEHGNRLAGSWRRIDSFGQRLFSPAGASSPVGSSTTGCAIIPLKPKGPVRKNTSLASGVASPTVRLCHVCIQAHGRVALRTLSDGMATAVTPGARRCVSRQLSPDSCAPRRFIQC